VTGSAGELTRALQGYGLVICDYDGTLAHLPVDWDNARSDLQSVAKSLGFESNFRPLWPEMARFKRLAGPQHVHEMFEVLLRHEMAAINQQSPRDQVIEAVRSAGGSLAVVSMNLRSTLLSGLVQLDLHPNPVFGCDSLDGWKPDPEGIYRAAQATGVPLGRTIFVGDSDRDAKAAEAAGVDYFSVAAHDWHLVGAA
jgi:phosphoglycolate phosphatase